MPNEKHWYVVYTASRAEKKVRERLEDAGIECYLPIQTVIRQWSYRKKKVEVPVLTGYIFVRISIEEKNNVLAIQGVVTFLKNRGSNNPATVPDKQLNDFRFLVDFSEEAIEMTNDNVVVGDTVHIIKGPLRGMIGELVQFNGKHKVCVRIEGLGCALTSIPVSFVETVNK